MKKNITLLLLIVSIFMFGQTQEATTKDGKKVTLKENGTWEYVKTDNLEYNFEFSSRPYYLNDGELKNFEKVKAKFEVKVKGMGYGGTESYLTAFGEKSNVRFDKSLPKILVKYEGNGDPEDLLTIVKAKKSKRKKDRRRFVQSSMAFGGKTRDTSKSEILYTIKKINENIYEIIIDSELVSGEYAIIPALNSGNNSLVNYNATSKIFCFGIN